MTQKTTYKDKTTWDLKERKQRKREKHNVLQMLVETFGPHRSSWVTSEFSAKMRLLLVVGVISLS